MASPSFVGLQIVTTLSFLLSLGAEVLIVVLVATVVRRHRPDAWRALLTWAVASIASTLLLRLGWALAPALTREGVEQLVTAQIVMTILGASAHIVLMLLLGRGLVKLAQPPKTEAVAAAGVYR